MKATILNHDIILRVIAGEFMPEEKHNRNKQMKEKCKTCGICYPRRKKNE